jgi:tetratricopeptide (TPR) repeat protein
MLRTLLFSIAFLLATTPAALAFRPQPTQAEIDRLTREIADEPGNSRPLQYRGLDYAILGEKEKAIADYRAAAKISPNQHYLFWSYGWALFDLGDYASAVSMWKAVLLIDKDHPEINTSWILDTLALGYWALGDRANAFGYFTEAAKLDSTFRFRDDFEQFTDHWTQKEQTIGLQLFDAWQKEVERPGSHLW